jgi:hypothetical protein
MKSLKLGFVILFSALVLSLSACSGGTQESAESNKTETAKTETAKTETSKSEKGDGHDDKDGGHSHSHKDGEHSHGGQVVESGAYHLELVTEKEDKGTHMHFHLEKGEKHEPVKNAKVTAQVQLPDGTQKNVDFKYDEKEKEYTATLPRNATGQYQMKVTANIGSEKVEGRFTVKQ